MWSSGASPSTILSKELTRHTLQSTALVHEAYVRLIKQDLPQLQNRAHFFAVAGTTDAPNSGGPCARLSRRQTRRGRLRLSSWTKPSKMLARSM